jgi:hypothetical protein
MFKNLDNDNNNDTEVGHTRSGRAFREVPLVNLSEQNHEPATQGEGLTQPSQPAGQKSTHTGSFFSLGPEELSTGSSIPFSGNIHPQENLVGLPLHTSKDRSSRYHESRLSTLPPLLCDTRNADTGIAPLCQRPPRVTTG